MTPEQIDYVKGELQRGVSEDTLRQTLANHGYQPEQVNQLLSAAKQSEVITSPSAQSAAPITASVATPQSLSTPDTTGMPTWLVVILFLFGTMVVIVAILSAVILSSLNNARDKGEDAMVKSALNITRAGAELYFNDNNDSYSGFCTDAAFTEQVVRFQEVSAAYECNDSATAWAGTVELHGGAYYCVDSSGFAEEISAPIGLSTSCSDEQKERGVATGRSELYADIEFRTPEEIVTRKEKNDAVYDQALLALPDDGSMESFALLYMEVLLSGETYKADFETTLAAFVAIVEKSVNTSQDVQLARKTTEEFLVAAGEYQAFIEANPTLIDDKMQGTVFAKESIDGLQTYHAEFFDLIREQDAITVSTRMASVYLEYLAYIEENGTEGIFNTSTENDAAVVTYKQQISEGFDVLSVLYREQRFYWET